ncbi:MAG: restriction endonuclease subunit S, partial [Candidatus Eremiobacterota bacterium]
MNNNWTPINLGDIFEIRYGKGLPDEARNKTGSIYVYGSNGIIGKHDKALTTGTTIIIGRKGSVGEVNFSYNNCWPIDTTYYIDTFPGNIPPKYWMHLLKSLNLGAQDKSSAIPGINRNDIYKVDVLLPPLNEQHRIVSKLEKLLSKVEACKDRLKKIPLILKRFRQSVLASACCGRLTADWREKNPDVEPAEKLLEKISINVKKVKKNSHLVDLNILNLPEIPEFWKYVSIDDLTNNIKYGTSQKCDYEKIGVPVLRIPNMADGIIDVSDLKYAELPENEYKNLKLISGDILLIRSNGSVSLVGKTSIVRAGEEGFAYAGYLIRLRFNKTLLDPFYINLALSSYYTRLQIEIPARSTSGVNNIN